MRSTNTSRFRYVLMLFLAGWCFVACTNEPQAAKEEGGATAIAPKPFDGIPQLPLDEQHNALWQDSAMPYFMRPLEKVVLNATDYQFSIPTEMNRPDILQKFGRTEPVVAPNIVHVLYRDNLYRTAWVPKDGGLILDVPALGGGQKNLPISRFEPRNTVYILIGYEGPVSATEEEAPFAPFYALRILVDENPMRFVRQSGEPKPIKKAPTSSTKP